MNYDRIKESMNFHRKILIEEFVKENKLIKLHNDYSSIIHFYYNVNDKILYKVCIVCDETNMPLPNFEIVNDKHILEINNIIE